MNSSQMTNWLRKASSAFLLCLAFSSPIIAQRVVKNTVTIQKTTFPWKFLEPREGTYLIKLVLADDQMKPKHDEYIAEIDKAIKLPGYKRAAATDASPQ